MKHKTPLGAQHLAILKKSKLHWQNGADPVDSNGLKQMDLRPLQASEHPRERDMAAYRAIRNPFL